MAGARRSFELQPAAVDEGVYRLGSSLSCCSLAAYYCCYISPFLCVVLCHGCVVFVRAKLSGHYRVLVSYAHTIEVCVITSHGLVDVERAHFLSLTSIMEAGR